MDAEQDICSSWNMNRNKRWSTFLRKAKGRLVLYRSSGLSAQGQAHRHTNNSVFMKVSYGILNFEQYSNNCWPKNTHTLRWIYKKWSVKSVDLTFYYLSELQLLKFVNENYEKIESRPKNTVLSPRCQVSKLKSGSATEVKIHVSKKWLKSETMLPWQINLSH